jgi:hypothetical protein
MARREKPFDEMSIQKNFFRIFKFTTFSAKVMPHSDNGRPSVRTDASNTYCKREIFDFGAFPKQSVTQTHDCPMAFGSPFELECHGWKICF